MTKMDRNERRTIGAGIRRCAKEHRDVVGTHMFNPGFCNLVEEAAQREFITHEQRAAFASLIATVLGRAAGVDCHTCFLPRAVTLKLLNKEEQSAVRASWLRHWEETGVALDYEGWRERAEARTAAALARKARTAGVGVELQPLRDFS